MTNTNDSNSINEWKEINEPVGKMLGYPQCCIDAFCEKTPEHMQNNIPKEEDEICVAAAFVDGKYTGFIPCYSHAKQVLTGEIELADLIQDRDQTVPPFPQY